MITAHNGTCTWHSNTLTDIAIARETGYDAIELIGLKLYRYLEQGLPLSGVVEALDGFPVVGLGYVPDIERHEKRQFDALLSECERMCEIAQTLHCGMVQLLTGPIGPGIGEGVPEAYNDIVTMSWPDLRRVTAKNLAELSKIGKQFDVRFYLEALSWTRIHTVGQMLELIDEAEADNVGMLIDFWHVFTSGGTPDEIAKLNKDQIYCVHYCDSVACNGSDHSDREVWTGGGKIPLKEWVEAIKATGFDGWWSCELFSPVHWELDPWQTANSLREHLVCTYA